MPGSPDFLPKHITGIEYGRDCVWCAEVGWQVVGDETGREEASPREKYASDTRQTGSGKRMNRRAFEIGATVDLSCTGMGKHGNNVNSLSFLRR